MSNNNGNGSKLGGRRMGKTADGKAYVSDSVGAGTRILIFRIEDQANLDGELAEDHFSQEEFFSQWRQ